MKFIKTLTVLAFATVLCASVALAADKEKPKFTDGSCCDKAAKAGKTCEHKCCVDATKEGKVCEKCNKKK